MPTLPRSFYARPTLTVARELLGKHLWHHAPGGPRGGRIVEVEAYRGPDDRASHARRRGQKSGPTPRTALMFGPGGVSYVYLVYGMHHCLNAVAHEEGAVGAVLIRALEAEGCRGPARLCAALGIDRRHNGLDLCGGSVLSISDEGTPVAESDVLATPRIGVDYAGEDALLPYRLLDRRSAYLSRRP